MLEKIITSKTRIKILKLFLTNIDDRYYLRELERKLDESLSPLRRQLMKLQNMGILIVEYEANLKYYRLNKNFTGIEELRKLVLGRDIVGAEQKEARPASPEIARLASRAKRASAAPIARAPRNDVPAPQPQQPAVPIAAETVSRTTQKQFLRFLKFDVAMVTLVSIFVLAAVTFAVYISTRNITQVAGLISERTTQGPVTLSGKNATATRPDEMVSRRWKVLPGNAPALSSGETGGEKRSEEL